MDGSHSGSGLRHGPLGRRHTAEIGDGTIGRGSLLSGRNLAYACDAADLASGRRGRHPLDAETLRPAHPVGQRIAGKRPATGAYGTIALPVRPAARKNAGGQQNPHPTTDRGGTEPAGDRRRHAAADPPADARRNRSGRMQRTVQRRQANLRPARGTRPARPGAASGRSPGKAGYRLFQKPLTGQYAGFRLVVGTVRHRSPAFGRPHRKIADRRTFRTAGTIRARILPCGGDLRRPAVPAARLRRVPDRLQRPYGRPASGAPRQGLHELRYFLSGHPVRRPDRRKLETPGTAGRLLRRNFVFRNGYRAFYRAV